MQGRHETDLQFRMLGPLEVSRGESTISVAPGRPRVLLALLLVHLGDVVSTDRLIQELWGGDPPASAGHALQVYISNLRKLLEPGRRPGDAARVLVTRPPGYVLEGPPDCCDARRFESLLVEGRRALDESRPLDAGRILDEALALWRGPVLADLADERFVQPVAIRLEELRLDATEARIEAHLAIGRHHELISELESLVHRHPFREHLWAHLMVALYRSGRQVDALRAFQRLRTVLAEELGLEPSPELRQLEVAVIRHDPALAAPPPAAAVPPEPRSALVPALLTDTEGLAGACEEAPAAAPRIPLPTLLTDTGVAFVGRDPELERLEQLWKEAGAGELRVVFVAGEPGVGKTRLADELATRIHGRGATVLAGRCDDDLGVPYQPFVEALRQFVDHTPAATMPRGLGRFGGELVRLVPELADRVSGLPSPLRSDPDTERYRLFTAVTDWIAAASADRPLLLVLDDLQWAGKPTLLLLRHVARATSPSHALVLGTYRDTELGADHPLVELLADLRRQAGVERLALAGLDEPGVAAFVAQAAGHLLDHDPVALARAIHRETEGNPFFVRQILRHLAETAAGQPASGGGTPTRGDFGVPEGVREVVTRRLARLSPETNRLLQTAAVVGTEFEPTLLQGDDHDEEALIAALEEATASRLVVEGAEGRYRFVHAIVRHTLYDGLSAVRRATLHRRVARGIERLHAGRLDDHLPALAHHFACSGADGAKVVDYASRAGERAMAQLGFEAAAIHYQQALTALDAMPGDDTAARAVVLLGLARARARTGDTRAADTYLAAAEAARAGLDAETLAGAALGLADLWSFSASVDDTRIALLEEARQALGGSTSPVTAQLLARLATELYSLPGSWDRREQLSAESIEVARRLDDPLTLALSLHARNYALWAPGGAEERLARGREIVVLAHRGADPELALQGHAWCQTALLELGDVAGLDLELAAYHRLAEDLRQPRYRWYACSRLGMRALLAGDLDEGERLVRHARDIGNEAGEPDAENVFGAQMRAVWLERPSREAIEVLDGICRVAGGALSADSPLVLAFRLIHLLLLLEVDGRDETRAELAGLLDFAIGKLDPSFYGMGWGILAVLLSTTADRLAAPEASATLYNLMRPYARLNAVNCGAVTFDGSYSHHLGMLAATPGRWDAAEEHWAEAAGMHERMGAGAYLARTRFEWARMLLGRGRPRDVRRAEELLAQAETAARALGLETLIRRAQALRH